MPYGKSSALAVFITAILDKKGIYDEKKSSFATALRRFVSLLNIRFL